MLKFRTTNKCTKYRKKHRKRGQTCLLRPSRGRKITFFVLFSRQLSRVQKDSRCCILLIYSILGKIPMAVCFSFSCFSWNFEGVHFLIFICNYLYIRYLYRYKKECIPHFFNWNNWNWTPGRVISTLPSLGLWTAFYEWVVSTAILLLKNKRCDFWVASLFLCTVWSHFYKDRLCPYINEW